MAELILVIMVIVRDDGVRPSRPFLVELFPTQIRYPSMSLPYHIANGWFGGMLPLDRDGDGGASRRHLLRAVVIRRRLDHDGDHPVRSFLTETKNPDIRSTTDSMLP